MKTIPKENHGAVTLPVDSAKKSLLEAFTNLMGGYPMMFVAGIIILPLSAGWIKEDPVFANMVITGVYASINFARSFLLRRIFAKYGIYDGIIKVVRNLTPCHKG